ncbi:MAG: hypothetical protein R2695_01220 [Acidimicrobiales bacterium]
MAAACILAFGLVCAILEARGSGEGQVIDAAMVDGAASLMTFFHGFRAMGIWNDERGTNMLDTGTHYYGVRVPRRRVHLGGDRSNRSSTPSCGTGRARRPQVGCPAEPDPVARAEGRARLGVQDEDPR